MIFLTLLACIRGVTDHRCALVCANVTVMMAPKQKMCRGTSGSGHLADVAAFGMWGGRIMKACRTVRILEEEKLQKALC